MITISVSNWSSATAKPQTGSPTYHLHDSPHALQFQPFFGHMLCPLLESPDKKNKRQNMSDKLRAPKLK